MKEKIKKLLKGISAFLVGLIVLLGILYFGSEIVNQYKYNYKYSIAMPEIIGEFSVSENYVNVFGLENSDAGEFSSLRINETSCLLGINVCTEKRTVITGAANIINIFPYYNEYKINYKDKNKIIFGNSDRISGEIDLNSKTLIYTVKSDYLKGNVEKIEVVTDNKKIEKIEKRTITKYLKKKWFKL